MPVCARDAKESILPVCFLGRSIAAGILAFAATAAAGRADSVQIIMGGADPTPAPVRHAAHPKPRATENPNAIPNPLVIEVGLEGRAPTPRSDIAAAPQTVGIPAQNPIVREAMSFLGVPYVWGGASPSGFDCSGFVQYVFRQMGRSVPRTADVQFANGYPVTSPEPGDLVFFQTYDWGASHVGIYLGNGYFINASRPDVHISNFGSSYFRSRYLGARRFV
jgi:cell wall-associated NlpC family hydrolase